MTYYYTDNPAEPSGGSTKQQHQQREVKHKRRYCKTPGCDRTIKSQGLCQRHGAVTKKCKVANCSKQAQGNFSGMCSKSTRGRRKMLRVQNFHCIAILFTIALHRISLQRNSKQPESRKIRFGSSVDIRECTLRPVVPEDSRAPYWDSRTLDPFFVSQSLDQTALRLRLYPSSQHRLVSAVVVVIVIAPQHQ